MIPPGVWFRFNCFPLRWYMGDGSMARCSAEIDEDLLVKGVPTRTYKYGGTGYGEKEGNGDSGLEYIQKLFNRNKYLNYVSINVWACFSRPHIPRMKLKRAKGSNSHG